MATITYIPEKTQSKTAMGKVMRYCARKDKTACEQDGRNFQLISGKDCCGETAYKEFMATKQQYGKAHGMFFYQYVQSFSPDENITPQMAHEIGCKFAEYFEGHEVLITTHTDAAHIHTHLVINSVNHENGKKLQMARGSIHKLRDFSDEICRSHNLSIVKPKEQGLKNIRTREYRAALKGESWKFKLINAVDAAMKQSRTKAEFIANVQKMGYGVNWSNSRKHITYTTPDGNKCRDNKMHDDKYLKHNMEVYYEYRAIKGFESAGKSDRGLQHKDTNVRYPAGNVGKSANYAVGDRTGNGSHATGNSATSDMAEYTGSLKSYIKRDGKSTQQGYTAQRRNIEINDRGQNGRTEIGSSQGYSGTTERYGETPNRSGFIPEQIQDEVGGIGSVGASDIIRIAQDIQYLVNPHNPKKEQEEREREQARRKQSQKRYKSHDRGMEL